MFNKWKNNKKEFLKNLKSDSNSNSQNIKPSIKTTDKIKKQSEEFLDKIKTPIESKKENSL